jgi:hypothetical protein
LPLVNVPISLITPTSLKLMVELPALPALKLLKVPGVSVPPEAPEPVGEIN